MAKRLNIDTHIHVPRHYSAIELLTAGIDLSHGWRPPGSRRRWGDDAARVRGVGGRLGP
jgi:hypothetical protein